MQLVVATSCRSSSLIHSQLKDVDEASSPIALPTQHIKLHCPISESKPAWTPHVKLKKQIARGKSPGFTKTTHTDRIGFAECVLPQHDTEPTLSLPSFSSNGNACEHILNSSPELFRDFSKASLSQSIKNHPLSKCSLQQIFTQPIRNNTLTPRNGISSLKSKIGLGCLPKAARVSVAPNSQANSFIYKNEYKSLIASSNVKQMSNLQRSRDLVTSASSPSRLKQLMKESHSQHLLMPCRNDR